MTPFCFSIYNYSRPTDPLSPLFPFDSRQIEADLGVFREFLVEDFESRVAQVLFFFFSLLFTFNSPLRVLSFVSSI
jgi:hypothetical protein